MTYFRRFTIWAKRAALLLFCGAFSGALIADIFIRSEFASEGEAGAMGALTGAILLGSPPTAVAAWFLLLHMVRQLSQAARGRE